MQTLSVLVRASIGSCAHLRHRTDNPVPKWPGSPSGGRVANIWVKDSTPPSITLIDSESLDSNTIQASSLSLCLECRDLCLS